LISFTIELSIKDPPRSTRTAAIRPDPGERVHWTNVSIRTKVCAEHYFNLCARMMGTIQYLRLIDSASGFWLNCSCLPGPTDLGPSVKNPEDEQSVFDI
jgi:hypothetical protein